MPFYHLTPTPLPLPLPHLRHDYYRRIFLCNSNTFLTRLPYNHSFYSIHHKLLEWWNILYIPSSMVCHTPFCCYHTTALRCGYFARFRVRPFRWRSARRGRRCLQPRPHCHARLPNITCRYPMHAWATCLFHGLPGMVVLHTVDMGGMDWDNTQLPCVLILEFWRGAASYLCPNSSYTACLKRGLRRATTAAYMAEPPPRCPAWWMDWVGHTCPAARWCAQFPLCLVDCACALAGTAHTAARACRRPVRPLLFAWICNGEHWFLYIEPGRLWLFSSSPFLLTPVWITC